MSTSEILNSNEALEKYLLKPVTKAKPTGDAKKHAEEFEAIKEQVNSLKSSGSEDDWGAFAESAALYLNSKAKDLRVMSYLCDALARTQSVTGVERGLASLAALIKQYPNTLLPVKPFSRKRSIAGIDNNMSRALATFKPNETQRKQLHVTVLEIQQAIDAEDVEVYDGEELSKLKEALAPRDAVSNLPEQSIPKTESPDTLTIELKHLAEIAVKPISAEFPAGEDIGGSEEYEFVRNEFAAIDSPTRQPDIDAIYEKSIQLIEHHCKDINLAFYATIALASREGVPGLIKGCHLLRQIIKQYPKGLSPMRPVARERSLAAMENRIVKMLGAIPRDNINLDDLPILVKELKEIDSLVSVDEDFGIESHVFGKATSRISDLHTDISILTSSAEPMPKAEPKTKPKKNSASKSSDDAPLEEAPNQVTATDKPTPAAPEMPAAGDSTSISNISKSGQEYITAIAERIGTLNPGNPVAYRLPRMWIWMRVETPPSGSLPPPQDHEALLTELNSAAGKGEWESVLRQAEDRALSAPLWFSLSRFVGEALQNLGHTEAAHGIAFELNALLLREPKLRDGTFSQDVPFLDAESKLWLSQSTPNSGSATNAENDERNKSAMQAAREQAINQKIDEALHTLLHQDQSLPSLRDRFIWRVDIMKFCCAYGHTTAALAQLRWLTQAIEQHALEAWEPSLAILTGEAALQLKKILSEDDNTLLDSMQLVTVNIERLWRLAPRRAYVATKE